VLYRLDPTGIAGVRTPGLSWAEAFFFSAQTLGSIGYGAMHPISLYTNLVVTVEALCGLLFIALTTGLAFARFARSTARIRFSQLAVVHAYNGMPTLVFRLANERRNGLLDARLRAFLAVDEVSSEGHRLSADLDGTAPDRCQQPALRPGWRGAAAPQRRAGGGLRRGG